jgi:hypothetical protein
MSSARLEVLAKAVVVGLSSMLEVAVLDCRLDLVADEMVLRSDIALLTVIDSVCMCVMEKEECSDGAVE